MPKLKRIEKAVAGGMAILSALLLAGIVTLFVMEIFMRYAMNAPTKWSNDVISFIMPAMIFLALPEVTRRNQHIAIHSWLRPWAMTWRQNGAGFWLWFRQLSRR